MDGRHVRLAVGGAFAVLALGSGCGEGARTGSPGGDAPAFPVPGDTAGPVVVARAPAAGSGAQAGVLRTRWHVADEPVLRVGGDHPDDDHHFVEITDAARTADGGVVVVDGRSGAVRRFGPDGRCRAALGATGEGPGEFRAPTQVGVGPDGTVSVWDSGLLRRTTFDADGGLIEVTAMNWEEVGRWVRPPFYGADARMLGDGSFVVRLVEKGAGGKGGGRNGRSGGGAGAGDASSLRRPGEGLIRIDPSAGGAGPLVPVPGAEVVPVEAPWGRVDVVPPLARTTLLAASPVTGRFCYAPMAGDGRWVRCLDPGGGSWTVRWQDHPRPVTSGDPEVARWRERMEEAYGLKLRPDDVQAVLGRVEVPRIRPPVDALLIAGDGRLWVGLGPTAEGTMQDFLVFADDGAFEGSARLPAGRVVEVGPEWVLLVTRDPFGRETLEMRGLVFVDA